MGSSSHSVWSRPAACPLAVRGGRSADPVSGVIVSRANKPLVPTRNGEAPLLAAQRRR